jgi:protein-disulfide isomerase
MSSLLSNLHLANAALAADVPQDEFEQRVRNYLLAHPEVIAETLNRLQAKQDEQDAAAAKSLLKARIADVFQDPDSPVGGNPNGNVTVVEFFDYNCPYCRAMAPLMEKAEAADPQLRIVYKEFPILSAGSVFAAKAALAANKQGKYLAFHRALYQVRGQIDETKLLEVAGTVGLDIARMKADMQDAAVEHMLDKNNKLAQALHITGTPGFVAGGPDRRDRSQRPPSADQQGTRSSAEREVSRLHHNRVGNDHRLTMFSCRLLNTIALLSTIG